MGDSLRVGIILDSFQVPAWIKLMLEKIERGGDGKFCLIILNQSELTARPASDDSRLYRFFSQLEQRFSHPLPDAMALEDIETWINQFPLIKAAPLHSSAGDSYPAEIIDLIKLNQLDVLIQTTERSLYGAVLEATPFGVWSIVPGDPHQNKRLPAGFWEVMTDSPVTGSALVQKVGDHKPAQILFESYSATDPLSVRRNCNRILWKSVSFIPRKLNEAKRTGKVTPTVPGDPEAEPGYQPPVRWLPSNGRLCLFLLHHLFEYLKNRWDKFFFYTQWLLFFDQRGVPQINRQSEIDAEQRPMLALDQLKPLRPPRPAFWSDPFLLVHQNKTYLFFEEFIYKRKKAHIGVMSIDEKSGECSTPSVALTRPYHLSYPFVFEWQGEVYMIPETAGNHCIEAYHCTDFPNHWEFYKTLMPSVNALDTTLFEYNGKWWMFTNIKENDGASSWDELFLFSSDSPLSSQWFPHPQNPIISDVRKARPAGRIFVQNGKIIRPAQDSSQGYGYGVVFNQILTLTETEYQEESIATLMPKAPWQGRGIHTFNFENRLMVVDGKSRRSKFPILV